MKTNLFQTIKHGLLMGIVAFSVVFAGLYFTAKSRLPDSSGLTAQSGDVLTADKWNNLVPNTMVGAFLSATCPTGRKPADGSDGTTDLRGVFLRGLNSFDGGSTTNARDPDCASRTGGCAIGSYQADQFKSHNHNFYSYTNAFPVGSASRATRSRVGNSAGTSNTLSAGGNETRGKNVAVIFCVRK